MVCRIPPALVAIPASLFALGCAPSTAERAVKQLTGRVAQLAREVRKQRTVVEDLSNRLFILQDRVDKNRVALGRRSAARRAPSARPRPSAARPRKTPPRAARRGSKGETDAIKRARRRLPVIKLRAGRSSPARSTRRGRARKPTKRIVLRLTGPPPSTTGRSSGSGRTQPPPPTVSERLSVVPLPRAPALAATSGPASEYQAAFQLLRKGSLVVAARAFSGFARRYPRHDYADNALYWLAECFYRRGKVRQAVWVLRRLLKKYPSGNKAPSALLKLGLCQSRLGRPKRARQVLGQVIRLYPGTREAKAAASRLRRMK